MPSVRFWVRVLWGALVALAAGVADRRYPTMPGMAGHMHMTELQAAGARRCTAKRTPSLPPPRRPWRRTEDYRKAIADGFEIFLPNVPQPQYHFTNTMNALAARSQFDPSKPTSLLYKKTADGGLPAAWA